MLSSETYEGTPIPLAVSGYVRPNLRTFDGEQAFVAPGSPSGTGYVVYPAPQLPPGDRLAALHLRTVMTAYDPFGRVADQLIQVNPAEDFPKPGRPLAATIGGAAAVEGADEATIVHPGEWVPFTLYWRVTGAPPPGNWMFFADLIDRENHRLLAESHNPGFSPDQWRSGDRVVSWFLLPIPGDTRAAVGDVAVGIFDPDTGRHLPVVDPRGQSAGDTLYVGPVRVDRPAVDAHPEHPLQARFGDGITLNGYDLTPADRGPLKLSLYWQSNRPIPDDYTVFVHVLDRSGRMIANADSQPGQGSLPTSTWVPGEPIVDVHQVTLPPGSPPPARIEAGIYLLATGQRLPLVGAPGDSITIALPE
jgi:hypothetical protein